MSIFRELFFPPVCIHCKQAAKEAYFCSTCWEASALADPSERCIHCFSYTGVEGKLCSRCAKKAWIPFQRASVFDRTAPIQRLIHREESIDSLASFALVQWSRLNWKSPDFIVPIPPQKSPLCTAFSKLMGKPSLQLFRKKGWPLGEEEWILKEGVIEDEATILLFDSGCSMRQLKIGSDSILGAFPKKVYVLSLGA